MDLFLEGNGAMKVVRSTERKQLEKLYLENGNRFLLLYGTAYTMKESLLSDFLSDKDYFYYRSRNVSPEEQKRVFLESIGKRFDCDLKDADYAKSLGQIRKAEGKHFVLVLDEFQYFLRKDQEIMKALSDLKAGKLTSCPVMIVLAASSLAWTVRDFDEAAGKAVAAIDERIKLSDVSFLDVVRAFPHYSVADAVRTYGILGGVPAYLDAWSERVSVKENVIRTMLTPDGLLYRAAEHYLTDELRELGVYNTILASMARGNEKLNDLYQDTGYSRAKISVYLKNLSEFDAITKVVSFETGGWDNAKKGIYRISNHFLRFWFTFIYPNLSELALMTPGRFYDRFIAPGLGAYLRPTFSSVCTEYLELMNLVGKTPIKLVRMGTWIGKQGTIDIVGQNEIRENIVAVCNWDDKLLTYERYELLLENMEQARIKAKVIYLFSATEFDSRLKMLEKEDSHIVLVDMKEL